MDRLNDQLADELETRGGIANQAFGTSTTTRTTANNNQDNSNNNQDNSNSNQDNSNSNQDNSNQVNFGEVVGAT